MAAGIATAMLVTALWVACHVLWMHVRPTQRRLLAMAASYAVSVPLTLPMVHVCRQWWTPPATEDPWLGVIHAFAFGLLFFLLFVECFYHVERSVTLRLLIEMSDRPPGRPVSLHGIEAEYNIDDMVGRRLALLGDRGFIEDTSGGWRLSPKGCFVARAMRASCDLFGSKTQDERL